MRWWGATLHARRKLNNETDETFKPQKNAQIAWRLTVILPLLGGEGRGALTLN